MKIAGGASVAEVAFAGEELAELLHQHLGYLDLGFAFGGVGDDAAVFVAPSWDHSGKKVLSKMVNAERMLGGVACTGGTQDRRTNYPEGSKIQFRSPPTRSPIFRLKSGRLASRETLKRAGS
jgi:hypothetical protein